jgi:hypothetical protein
MAKYPRRAFKRKTSSKAKASLVRTIKRVQYSTNERKWSDYTVNFGAAGAYGAAMPAGAIGPYMPFPNIAIGTDVHSRIGNKIHVNRIVLMIRAAPTGTSMAGGSACRFLAWYYPSSVASMTPAVNDLLMQDIAPTTPQYTSASLRNLAVQPRLHLLADKLHSFTSQSGTNAGPEFVYQLVIPFKKTVVFNGTTGTYSDIVKNLFCFAFVVDSANCCTADVRCRVEYTDA